jgi:squalene-hopene/tetraprenyl-beta-curcumene cyclase
MTPPVNLPDVREALAAARARLLACRGADRHWTGRLSSSALSTATAAYALAKVGGAEDAPAVHRALEWLAKNQNSDGGWGDTTLSKSNISTTLLGWSALSLAQPSDADLAKAAGKAEAWIAAKAGGTDGERIARAVDQVYGDDRSFSAPILAMCALAGRLGRPQDAWRNVAPLPFELGLFSHRWLKWLRVPVVSYALPALIAIGLLRHHFRRPRCPVTRLVRAWAKGRALARLQRIQPSGGGFLEAIPLTSFVVMSLAAIGRADHPVVARGAEFLRETQRADGSWPIDTNLATWVTTLSVGALAASDGVPRPCESSSRSVRSQTAPHAPANTAGAWHPATGESPGAQDRELIRGWLLVQQHRVEHPYTGAAPGGWAWTDLDGGVPDADDTAGALLALHHLDADPGLAVESAVRWLAAIQNRDGGIPTFCRGWGKLPFDRSSPDLTAHAIAAWSAWRDRLPPALQANVDRATAAALRFLTRSQAPDGSWAPLWFGNEHAPACENRVYGTARVLEALAAHGQTPRAPSRDAQASREMMSRAVGWLVRAASADGGWGGDGSQSGIEETALATGALAGTLLADVAQREDPGNLHLSGGLPFGVSSNEIEGAVHRGAAWLLRATNMGAETPPSPIGLYFASLWYYEELYPLIFTVWALGRCADLLSRHGPGDA